MACPKTAAQLHLKLVVTVETESKAKSESVDPVDAQQHIYGDELPENKLKDRYHREQHDECCPDYECVDESPSIEFEDIRHKVRAERHPKSQDVSAMKEEERCQASDYDEDAFHDVLYPVVKVQPGALSPQTAHSAAFAIAHLKIGFREIICSSFY